MNLKIEEIELVAEVLCKSQDLGSLFENLNEIIHKKEHYFLAKTAYSYAALYDLEESGVPLIEAQELKKDKLKQELLKANDDF